MYILEMLNLGSERLSNILRHIAMKKQKIEHESRSRINLLTL